MKAQRMSHSQIYSSLLHLFPRTTLLSSLHVSSSLFTTVRLQRHHHHTNSVISRNGETFISQFSPDELRRNSCESLVKPFKGRTSQPSSTIWVRASMEIPSRSRLQHHPQHSPSVI
ncbi:hypothetical protein Ancab_013228 [Ancistrocladus abbreviatus]